MVPSSYLRAKCYVYVVDVVVQMEADGVRV